MYKIFNIVIVCLSLFINNLLFADSKLNEIVVTPSLRETTIFDSLSSIEIITKEEIQALGHSNVNDILSHSSSINIGSNGGHGQTKSIFLRGTDGGMKIKSNYLTCWNQLNAIQSGWHNLPTHINSKKVVA